MLFYDAQRSGKLPSTVQINWRGDSSLKDVTYNGVSLVGGFYDAGDLSKFAFPAAQTFATLAWSMIEFKSGWSKAGALASGLRVLRSAAEFMITSHISDREFVVQIGDPSIDHTLWRRPEDITTPSEVFILDAMLAGGSDVLGGSAAALAATSMVFATSDANFSASCLSKAQALYKLAIGLEDVYDNNVPTAAVYYSSSGYFDDLTWAATWLYYASKEKAYLEDALQYYQKHIDFDGTASDWNFSWDHVFGAATVLLYRVTGDSKYASAADSLMDQWLRGGKNVVYTPKGLAFANEWGSLRHAANQAFLGQVYARYRASDSATARHTCFALRQLRYMAGEGGRSYIVGVGKDPPCRVHHRAASCPAPPAACDCGAFESTSCNPHMVYGALVGGPGREDNYTDVRSNWRQNEVALDYNAGFSGALAGLMESSMSWQQCVAGGWLNSAGGAAEGGSVLLALVSALLALLLVA